MSERIPDGPAQISWVDDTHFKWVSFPDQLRGISAGSTPPGQRRDPICEFGRYRAASIHHTETNVFVLFCPANRAYDNAGTACVWEEGADTLQTLLSKVNGVAVEIGALLPGTYSCTREPGILDQIARLLGLD